jgi:hypothetical protein
METNNLFGLDGLADLGSRTGADMRPTLLRVLTDLYVHRLSHTPDEERHYTELALRLLEDADVTTRVTVARRFAHYLWPPLRVLQWLAADLPEVAAELRAHPLLRPSAPPDDAVRQSAVAPVTEDTASDEEVLLAGAAGAAGAIDLATAGDLNNLFFAANADERRLILLNLNIVAPIQAGTIRVSRDPSVSQRLEAAALGGNREAFAHELALALQIPREQARRIAHDELGEPVVVAAKTLGMPRNMLYRVLMFVNPAVGHSVERVHALAALNDEMPQPAAEGMAAIWQALQQIERAGTKHQPLTWNDEPRRRALRAAAVHRSSVAPRTSGRRSAS